jgi:hypothetical protein
MGVNQRLYYWKENPYLVYSDCAGVARALQAAELSATHMAERPKRCRTPEAM